ncbi:MAG: ATP-binding protein [Desulfobacterales bacterium]|nr:ATP-binding protein [Desulfobacterales bacterium]
MTFFRPNTPRPHAFVLSIYVLIVLIGFSSLLLFWSYQSGIQALDDGLEEGFKQRRTVSEIIFEHQMALVDMALKEILEDRPLLAAASGKDRDTTRQLLLSAIDDNTSFYLDISFLNLPDTPVWVDASSSFYNFKPVLKGLASQPRSKGGMIFTPDAPNPLTVAVKSLPMVHPSTGKVLGHLTGGFVLNNHMALMEQIQVKTRSKLVALFSEGRLIAASDSVRNESVRELTQAYNTLTPGEHLSGKGLIAGVHPLRINGSATSLEIVFAVSDTAYQELIRSYQVKTLAMSALAMVFALISAWVIRRLTAPPLNNLMVYAGEITSGNMDATFKPGMLTELNQVGHSMETMVESLANANTELLYLRNYLSNIIDSMPSALVGIDTDGHVTQWNQRAVDITGISQEEALGSPLSKVFPRLAGEMERIEVSIRQRRSQILPKNPFRRGDDIFYEDITIYPLTANGAEGAVIRIDDVSDKVRMEERMIQSEKMMSVGGLAAGMAHEINNPLAGMIQTADTLKKRLTTIDLPANKKTADDLGISMTAIREFMTARKVPRMLETIRTSGLRAADIVTNMLTFARKGDSGMLLNDLALLMDETLSLAASDYDLKKSYDFKEVNIIKNYHRDMPQVPCEPGKIQQVFLNILTNGAQAMCGYRETAGPEYTPEFFISIQPDITGTMVRIEIEDNGPGMDEKTRKRVFEPFFTTKPEGEGTGLGLSVSYFIINENHNGQLSVSSTPGAGTSFLITLPMKQSSAHPPTFKESNHGI